MVAAALGVWVAGAAAHGGFGAGASGTNGCEPVGATIRCPPMHPSGFGGAGGGGGGGGRHRHGTGAGAHRRGGSSEGEGAGTGTGAHRGGKPQRNGRPPNFTFSVRLGHDLSSGANGVHGYSTHVLLPPAAPSSCAPPLTRRSNIASRHQVARIHLRPPAGGWCDGRYRVTVTLNP